MDLEVIKDVTLSGDNKMSITLIRNVKSQHQTKHIDVQHHYIGELINEKELTAKWISSFEMLANGMTKELSAKTFRKYRALLGIAID